MKFIMLVWALSWKMFLKSRTNENVQQHIGDKSLVFQLQTNNGRICRQFVVGDQKINSRWGKHNNPTLRISFQDAKFGAEVLTAEWKTLAFMEGFREEKIKVEGDLTLFNWYVELGTKLNS